MTVINVAVSRGYGVAEAEGDADALADPEAETSADAVAETDGAALPEALGAAEKLGRGLGVGDGNRVVGTFAKESAKIRTTITRTMTTHGRARESLRGGSAPR